MQKEKIEKLASEKGNPCVTISMNTHRTSDGNQQDVVELRKLIKEAHEHVKNEFGQHEINNLLDKIDNLEQNIDVNHNLESVHIFLSDETTEIVKSLWPISKNVVSVTEYFVIKPLIKDFNRIEEYLILVLSQSGVRLLRVINDSIAGEIKGDEFPFAENPFFLTNPDKSKDGKQVDNMICEFFNQVDKAVLKIHHKTAMNVVVICTEKNWSSLLKVADKPSIYIGNFNINTNDSSSHSIAGEAWQIVSKLQEKGRVNAIQEMKDAAVKGLVITDLLDIFHAVQAGRGDLLITHDDYHQAVKMNGQNSFLQVDDVTQHGVIDDITSEIAWEVISKKGRAIFTNQEEFRSLGNIALKVRY
jgi:hypothetical protein